MDPNDPRLDEMARFRSISLRLMLEGIADGTRITTVGDIEPRRALKPFWWIALPILRLTRGARLQRLKRALEAAGDRSDGSNDAH